MARRSYGTGNLRVRRGAWYGMWWVGGRRVQRKLGPVREPGTRRGLTKRQAEAVLRRRIEATAAPAPAASLAEVGERLVRSLEAQGRKASTLAAYESTLRTHLVPHFGARSITRITTEEVEGFIAACRARDRPRSRFATTSAPCTRSSSSPA